MFVLTVRMKSGLADEEMMRTAEARAPQFRALPGLVQKYYLKYPATGEVGAVYLWETREALEAFRASELARTIPEAYQTQGAPDLHVGEVILTLR